MAVIVAELKKAAIATCGVSSSARFPVKAIRELIGPSQLVVVHQYPRLSPHPIATLAAFGATRAEAQSDAWQVRSS